VVATFTGGAMDIGAFEKQTKLGSDVLRFLITVKEPSSSAGK
jgi:ribosomal protein S6